MSWNSQVCMYCNASNSRAREPVHPAGGATRPPNIYVAPGKRRGSSSDGPDNARERSYSHGGQSWAVTQLRRAAVSSHTVAVSSGEQSSPQGAEVSSHTDTALNRGGQSYSHGEHRWAVVQTSEQWRAVIRSWWTMMRSNLVKVSNGEYSHSEQWWEVT